MAKKPPWALRERTALEKQAVRMLQHQVSPTRFHSQATPYCDNPLKVHQYQRPSPTSQGVEIERMVACRKCEKCLRFRRLQWRDRMANETRAVPRTWLVTLTFSPVHLAGIMSEAWQLVPRGEQVSEVHVERAAYAHVQKYLKRLRKNGSRFRYCGIAEYGSKRGRLHFHLLVHETEPMTVTYRNLETQWRSFVGAELVKTAAGGASYVSKYLTKSIAKIRSSNGYGKTVLSPTTDADGLTPKP